MACSQVTRSFGAGMFGAGMFGAGTTRAILLSLVWLILPAGVQASCGLEGAARELVRELARELARDSGGDVADPLAARNLSQKIAVQGICSVCHLAGFGGPRNEFGNTLNTLLTLRDRRDPVRQRDLGRRMLDIPANPSLAQSPTFGQLFQQGQLPSDWLANQESPRPQSATRVSESLTVPQATQRLRQAQSEARFGILQLSRTTEITAEVAEVLAKFRGEALILGIQSLSPEVATALAQSEAEIVWLHSLTAVSPAATQALAKLKGRLVLTGLAKLDSVQLAEKLAAEPAALSFPFLSELTPEVAAALAKSERSLTLAGLSKIPREVQTVLARTVGSLSLPNVQSLDSLALAEKLAATVVLLPRLEELTVEQVKRLVGVKGQDSFFGGVYLPLAVVTPEIAAALAATPRPINLTLLSGEVISDAVLRTLLNSRLNATLADVEKLSPEQIGIVSDALAGVERQVGVLQRARLNLPQLRKLDSAVLAETLARSTGFYFPGVTEISPAAAAALGNFPNLELERVDGSVEIRPSGELSFPSLQEISPETARLLFKKRWLSITLPALQDVSLETVRLIARQTFRLNLGVPALPVEFAEAFAQTPTDLTQGGGFIVLPKLTDISPAAARRLVDSLNRGVQELNFAYGRQSASPKLYLGGDLGVSVSGFPRLSPEVARELARYEGTLSIQGLSELPDESAAALASFPGPYLILSGPGVERLSPAAAESLAQVPGVLLLPLRQLDSVPLAQRFAKQMQWTLSNLETVSAEAAPALSQYRQFFNLDSLTTLDSIEMAQRFVDGTTSGTGITLLSLHRLSPAAAEILANGSKKLTLGLTVLDSPDTARSLAKCQAGVDLPRLRAVTPTVSSILQEAKSLKTPPLESLYLLSETKPSRD